MAQDDYPTLNDDALRHASEHGLFHRCMQEDTVDGLKITVGAMEHSLSELEKTTNETLERLEQKLDAVTRTIEENNLMVKVTSNGIAAQVRLNDIIQFFMDRPSAQVRKVESVLNRIVDSAKDIVWIFGAITVALYTMNTILKFMKP